MTGTKHLFLTTKILARNAAVSNQEISFPRRVLNNDLSLVKTFFAAQKETGKPEFAIIQKIHQLKKRCKINGFVKCENDSTRLASPLLKRFVNGGWLPVIGEKIKTNYEEN